MAIASHSVIKLKTIVKKAIKTKNIVKDLIIKLPMLLAGLPSS